MSYVIIFVALPALILSGVALLMSFTSSPKGARVLSYIALGTGVLLVMLGVCGTVLGRLAVKRALEGADASQRAVIERMGNAEAASCTTFAFYCALPVLLSGVAAMTVARKRQERLP